LVGRMRIHAEQIADGEIVFLPAETMNHRASRDCAAPSADRIRQRRVQPLGQRGAFLRLRLRLLSAGHSLVADLGEHLFPSLRLGPKLRVLHQCLEIQPALGGVVVAGQAVISPAKAGCPS
jgi:hypothetical protein